MIKPNRIWLSAIAVVLGLPIAAQASPFAAGDIVVEQIGTGAAVLSSAAQAVFLDEYTPTGTLVQSIALPTASSGSQDALTESGSATSDGMLNLSTNGHYLTVTGYNAAPGTAAVAGTASATVNRVVGLVNASGSVDTSTHAAIYSADNIRGAATTDGTSFYVGGAGTSPDEGIFYLPFGSTSATNLNSSIKAGDVSIFGNTLYASTGTGSNTSIVQVGTAGTLPTSASSLTQLTGIASGGSPHQFAIFNESGTQVAYISDDTGKALTKYELVSGTWTAKGTVGTGGNDFTGLTGSISGTTVTLFATELNGDATSGGAAKLVSIVDSSGAGGTLSGTPTTLVTAGTNQTFAGVAFAPTPEPASVIMAVMGFFALVGYGWRRRQAT